MGLARNDHRRGRWLERLTGGRYKRMVFETKTVTATKAVIQDGDRTGFPHIEVSFMFESPIVDKRTGEMVDEMRTYLTLAEASKLTQQMLNSISAATPRIPRPAANSPFDAS